MKHLYKAFYGALLVLGLAGVTPVPALAAGYHWDSVCNCRRPDSQYNTRRVECAPARVVTHRRIVTHNCLVRGRTTLIQENRLIVHVRPVIHREVVMHRTHTIVKNVVVHRVNTTNKWREVNRTQVINVNGGGTTRHITEYRNVRGVNCNCGYQRGGYERRPVVSYRY